MYVGNQETQKPLRSMRTLELVQPFLTSFEDLRFFWVFLLCLVLLQVAKCFVLPVQTF